MSTTFISTSHARRKLRVLVGGIDYHAGRVLHRFFERRGFEVIPVASTRSGVFESDTIIDWHMIQEFGLPRCDYVVNASGSDVFAGVAQFSDFKKQEYERARLLPTKLLTKVIKESDRKPMAYMTLGSAFIYPGNGRSFTEDFAVPNNGNDLSLSYFTRFEREVERASQVYDAATDKLPTPNPHHVDPSLLYKDVTHSSPGKGGHRDHDSADLVPDSAVYAQPGETAAGEGNVFSSINVQQGQFAASVMASNHFEPDENMRSVQTASSMSVNSNPITNEQVRVINARMGHVLGAKSTSLRQLDFLRQWGLLGKTGSGEQLVPWIHERDLAGLVLHSLVKTEFSGPINMVAPVKTPNAEFMTELSIASGSMPAPFRIPEWIVEKNLGPVSAQLVLNSYNVEPKKALEIGYQFQFTDIKEAMDNALSTGHDD